MICARLLPKFLSLLGECSLRLEAAAETCSRTSNGGASRRLSTCSSEIEILRGRTAGGKVVVMGIESSCDDTGVAVVDESGRVLGDAIHSQLLVHKQTGGIVPHVAGQLHHQNLDSVTAAALEKSGCGMEDVSVVAVTIGPGLAPCLKAGLSFAKDLAHKYELPLCPVHHMAAHALMPRLKMNIPFPFLVLLVSGGHCILATAESPGEFKRLGETRDDSPGEAFDKVARWLNLHKHKGIPSHLHGGAAIEVLAKQGCPEKIEELSLSVMTKSRCCDFSFSGVKTCARNIISRIASESGWVEREMDRPLPQCEDIAAAFQETVFKHLLQRTQRALIYSQQNLPQVKHLVVSGGVASNLYLREKLGNLCDDHSFTLHTPPPHLCTDNGIMIAWAALEHLKWAEHNQQSPWQQSTQPQSNKEKSFQLLYEMDSLEFKPRWPLGEDVSEHVKSFNIKLPKSNYFKRQPH